MRAETFRQIGSAYRLITRLVVAAFAVVLLTGFGEPKPKFSLEREAGKQISARGHAYRQYHVVTDNSSVLQVEAPTQWAEVSGASQFVRPGTGERYGAGVLVSPNLDKFRSTFEVAGYRLTATHELPSSVDKLLTANAENYAKNCRKQRVRRYDDGRYVGKYQFFTRCGRPKTAALVVSATSTGENTFIVVAAQVRTRADLAAIDRAIRSSKLT